MTINDKCPNCQSGAIGLEDSSFVCRGECGHVFTPSMTFGVIPDDLTLTEPYPMRLMGDDFDTFAAIVNQGIDSHLEAVHTTQDGRNVTIQDTASMRCFLRRCVESGNEAAESLASDIVGTLGYEWI